VLEKHCIEELHRCCFSPDIIGVIKSRRWNGQGCQKKEKMLMKVTKHEGKRHLGGPSHR